MQIAITVPDEQVDEIDRLVPTVYRSRAEVVRLALDDFLRSQRRRIVDERYIAALDASPADESVPRLRVGDPTPPGWDEIAW